MRGNENAEVAAPEVAGEVLSVQADKKSLAAEGAETEERPDADAPQSRRPAALGGKQAKVVVALLAEGVHLGVEGAIVGLLVEGQPVHSGFDHLPVARLLHRVDLDGDGGEEVADALRRRRQELIVDRPRRFAGDQQDMAEPPVVQHLRLPLDLVEGQSLPRHLVVALKPQ
jgi:hypothetical protein